MPTVNYIAEEQGYRKRSSPPLGGIDGRIRRSLRGLGDASTTFSGCAQAYDSNGNPVACDDASAAVWVDVNGNAVPPGTAVGANAATAAVPSSGAAPSSQAGAPTGAILVYQGTWQAMPTLNPNSIVAQVSAALKAYGLQVVNSQSTGGALTIGNFNVALTLQVTGAGFAQPSDAGSIVDHAYYTVTGHMPVSSGTFLQSAPGVPSNQPGGQQPGQPESITEWFEDNAWWILALGAAALVLPKVL